MPSAQQLYLDLLVRTIAGTVYKDPSLMHGKVNPHDPGVRHTGGDWPAMAHSMIGTIRLQNVCKLAERAIQDHIAGHFIETGVWRGGACILMRGVLAAYGITDRKVYVADSFKGLPTPDAVNYPLDQGSRLFEETELAITRLQVEENFGAYGLLDGQVVFLEGWFKDTLSTLTTEKFALIRLDGDLYESTMQALEALYPRLAVGGFVIIDDYGGLVMCARAVEDYRSAHGITEPLHEIDWTGRWWQKAS
jgi:O-methyltransferase